MTPLIDIHTHSKNHSENSLSIYNLDLNDTEIPKTIFSSGIHPWKIDPDNSERQIENLNSIAQNPNCRFIGETGLDKIKGPDLDLQKSVFQKHIDLATMQKLPLIIHCVKAHNEVLEMLKENNISNKVIFHGFDKKLLLAREIIKNGHSISLGKSLFTKPEIMLDVLKMIPHEFLFFETDDSKYSIEEVYQQAARLSGHSLDYWKGRLYDNYKQIMASY